MRPKRSIPTVVRIVLGCVAAAALASCDTSGPGPRSFAGTPAPMPHFSPGGPMQPNPNGCPMVVRGAAVAVADTDLGVALTFTSPSDNTTDLRQRVRDFARMYQTHSENGTLMWHRTTGTYGPAGQGHMGSAGQMGQMGPMIPEQGLMPAAHAMVSDVGAGARIELTPDDPAQLTALREHVRIQQQHLQSGECWTFEARAPDAQHAER